MMTAAAQSPTVRNWADFLTILTGVSLLAISIWPGEPTASVDAAREVGDQQAVWSVHLTSGISVLIAVWLAQRWRRRGPARALLIGVALALLATLFVVRDFGPRAFLSLLLPALVLLVASFAIGPVPLPQETGPTTRLGDTAPRARA